MNEDLEKQEKSISDRIKRLEKELHELTVERMRIRKFIENDSVGSQWESGHHESSPTK